MKQITVVLALIAVCVGIALAFNHSKERDPLFEANVDALVDNENGYGLLWEKHWTECTVILQIIVNSTTGNIRAGTYAYSAALLSQLEAMNASYTLVEGGRGLKSYCFDGWSFCSEDDCR